MKDDGRSTRQLKHLGERLRRLRKEMGVTQAKMARRAGVDPRYYSRIERGEVNVTYLTLMKLTRTLRVCSGILFFPAARLDEAMARACACISQMKSDNNRRGLEQTASFAKHVLGVKPKLGGSSFIRKKRPPGRPNGKPNEQR